MKSTGIVRKLDQLGRVVIPIELRRVLHIKSDDSLEIFVNGESVVLRKYTGKSCTFCGKNDNITSYKDKYVCRDCIEEMRFKIS